MMGQAVFTDCAVIALRGRRSATTTVGYAIFAIRYGDGRSAFASARG